MKHSVEQLRAWVGSMHGWSDSIIQNWSDTFPLEGGTNDITPFIRVKQSFDGPLDMQKVVGQRDHNAGVTWRDALLDNRYRFYRMERVLAEYEKRPDYYFSTHDKTDIGFLSVDGEHWYSTEGNHRTIAAKFIHAFAEHHGYGKQLLHPVTLRRYEIDFAMHRLHRSVQELIEAKELPILIWPRSDTVAGDSRNREYRLEYALRFVVCDRRFDERYHPVRMSVEQFQRYAAWLLDTQGALTRWDRMEYSMRWFWGKKQTEALMELQRMQP